MCHLPTEVEAKFLPDAQAWHTLPSLTTIGAFDLDSSPPLEVQRNRYFDSANFVLRQQHYGLRIREIGARRVATLKGPTAFVDGVHRRAEWEVDIGPDDAITSWPAGEVRDRALALLAGAAVAEILTIATNRRRIIARHAGVLVAEIALDDARIDAGGRSEQFHEIEAELLPGAALAQFEALIAALRIRFTLQPSAVTKLARGMQLLNGDIIDDHHTAG